jgi:hypothetical protein
MEEVNMNLLQKTTRLFAILAFAVILVGCTGPTVVVPPTQDIPQIRTESAQTVVAKLTIAAALEPSATTAAPATAAPTEAPAEAATATSMPSPTPLPVLATATPIPTLKPVTGVVYPTATRRAGPDQAQFVSQEPLDGTDYNAGAEFDAAWTLKNVGTTTWSTDYDIRFSGGTNLSPVKTYPMTKTVAPGETVTLFADMVAPTTAGRYVSYWEVINGNGDVFYQMYVVIDVLQ